VDAAFVGDPQDVRTWPVLNPLAPHAEAVAGYADTAGIAEPTVDVMGRLASLFRAKALHRRAEPHYRRALAIAEAGFPPTDPRIAACLNNLAQLLQATNRLGEAEPLMRRALAIDEASYGQDHPNVATDLNNLAQLLKATNRLGEAESLMRRHLAIFLSFQRDTGHAHPHRDAAIGNYAGLLGAMGKGDVEIDAMLTALRGEAGLGQA
jgi:tetratricopeptide (TPR) repeat protein